ncbi:RNA polymerase sigma factor [Rhizobium sp. WL3]|jgi:RNA polymerase sigma factor (sigma-70 family)|uniref:RNA polymerase sigma factor n=1 Tax=Rhizobium rhizophilum TaxID=1850373 RepID=A0ABY2QZ14_9HYPH|nr:MULTISPECIES: RNA polymerase sigma factor [Rhizobium]QEE46594.1 RNA polymerase sigma factor [Rhizobium sp. WL3]THV16856.1 RNA polymerase sigma factor [Rhizobium rhizophilum]
MTGDTQRLDEAFLGMRPSLYRAILRIVRDASEAEELTHDAYLRARRALEQGTPGNVEGFLWQTARNLALDHLRRRKVRSLHEERDFDAADAVVADPQPSIEDQAIQRDMVQAFNRALLTLPPRARSAWCLNRLEGLAYPEIAKRLGVSPNTVFNDMKMAMAVLLEIRERMDR